jgi:GTP-binding protein
VGFPNAGKSTLLSVISAAKPKIADYAFTTLTPQLGWLNIAKGKVFAWPIFPESSKARLREKDWVIAFLRHIERNAVLLFVIPADSPDHKKEFDILVSELEQYNSELLHKKFIIAVSKADMLDDELKDAISRELPQDIPHFFISAITQKGLINLKDALWEALKRTHTQLNSAVCSPDQSYFLNGYRVPVNGVQKRLKGRPIVANS